MSGTLEESRSFFPELITKRRKDKSEVIDAWGLRRCLLPVVTMGRSDGLALTGGGILVFIGVTNFLLLRCGLCIDCFGGGTCIRDYEMGMLNVLKR
ncbi:hypothetical protein V6N13_080531 [Hibiscus sabdariffa]